MLFFLVVHGLVGDLEVVGEQLVLVELLLFHVHCRVGDVDAGADDDVEMLILRSDLVGDIVPYFPDEVGRSELVVVLCDDDKFVTA